LSRPPNPPLDTPNEFAVLVPPPAPPVSKVPDENPPWSGWDVLALAGVTIVAILISLIAVTVIAHKFLFPHDPITDVLKFPELIVLSQALAYVIVLATMVVLALRHHTQTFAQAIRWNWPELWFFYLFQGVLLCLALQAFAHSLPIPKNLPMDKFFQTRQEAYILSIFGVTFAPVFEEFFFRGFLYPVLARRLGMGFAIFLTALAFAGIHGDQLMYSWGPVLVIFMVGLVLTITRALTRSVASSLLIHIAYNGTISVAMFFATDHFRHLEKLNR
jgi:membrane protease YdiL (CAAX protease family)